MTLLASMCLSPTTILFWQLSTFLQLPIHKCTYKDYVTGVVWWLSTIRAQDELMGNSSHFGMTREIFPTDYIFVLFRLYHNISVECLYCNVLDLNCANGFRHDYILGLLNIYFLSTFSPALLYGTHSAPSSTVCRQVTSFWQPTFCSLETTTFWQEKRAEVIDRHVSSIYEVVLYFMSST